MIMFHVNYLGAWPQFTGSRINVKESYAVQASERAAAALARRRKEMVTDRFMKAAYKAKALRSRAYQWRAISRFEIISSSRRRVPPVVPSGSWSTAKNCIWVISSVRFPRRLRKFMQGQHRHMITGKLSVIQANSPENGFFFSDDSRLFPDFPFRRDQKLSRPVPPRHRAKASPAHRNAGPAKPGFPRQKPPFACPM